MTAEQIRQYDQFVGARMNAKLGGNRALYAAGCSPTRDRFPLQRHLWEIDEEQLGCLWIDLARAVKFGEGNLPVCPNSKLTAAPFF